MVHKIPIPATNYPRPRYRIHGRIRQNSQRRLYGLKIKAITTRNPQANAIIELVHQTIGNIIRTFDVQTMDTNNPWAGILAATMFSVCATYHTTLQASPMQLVFGRDAILNVKHITNWEHIQQRLQTRINENNERENKSRRVHQYSLPRRQ